MPGFSRVEFTSGDTISVLKVFNFGLDNDTPHDIHSHRDTLLGYELGVIIHRGPFHVKHDPIDRVYSFDKITGLRHNTRSPVY